MTYKYTNRYLSNERNANTIHNEIYQTPPEVGHLKGLIIRNRTTELLKLTYIASESTGLYTYF